jgi:hypothetical protein
VELVVPVPSRLLVIELLLTEPPLPDPPRVTLIVAVPLSAVLAIVLLLPVTDVVSLYDATGAVWPIVSVAVLLPPTIVWLTVTAAKERWRHSLCSMNRRGSVGGRPTHADRPPNGRPTRPVPRQEWNFSLLAGEPG